MDRIVESISDSHEVSFFAVVYMWIRHVLDLSLDVDLDLITNGMWNHCCCPDLSPLVPERRSPQTLAQLHVGHLSSSPPFYSWFVQRKSPASFRSRWRYFNKNCLFDEYADVHIYLENDPFWWNPLLSLTRPGSQKDPFFSKNWTSQGDGPVLVFGFPRWWGVEIICPSGWPRETVWSADKPSHFFFALTSFIVHFSGLQNERRLRDESCGCSNGRVFRRYVLTPQTAAVSTVRSWPSSCIVLGTPSPSS